MTTPFEKAAREAAIYWTECKEQATAREWSAYGDRRVEAFQAGAHWARPEEIARCTCDNSGNGMCCRCAVNHVSALSVRLAASEAREVQLRCLLKEVEAHFANGSDDEGMDLWRRISDALSTTEPPPLLGVLKEVEWALELSKHYLEMNTGAIRRGAGDSPEPVAQRITDALASIRAALGGREG